MRAISILTFASAMALGASADAATFSGQGVDIVDAAAVIHVIPEDRTDFAIETAAGPRLAAPQVRVEHGRVVIDGNVRVTGCGSMFGNESAAHIAGVGAVRRRDMPVVTIRAPRTIDLSTDGAVFVDVGASSGGRLAFGGCGDSTVAPVTGDLDLSLRGSGDADVANVSGALSAHLGGSGDLRAREAASARLSLQGSGDVSLDRVRGGPLDAMLAGSGDVRVGSVQGGSVSMRLDGSGDLAVQNGSADHLDADLAGSGNLSFGGHVDALAARLAGSGDLRVASADHIESMRKAGSGDITIGD
ncbi:MAG TPA: DUF2807 domain-containing protein [Caulobacterales bacterium]|nr:DUF2807 domain-containing protein [Caulobacterales bacterium]